MTAAILGFLVIAAIGIFGHAYQYRDAISMYWRKKPPE